MKKVLLFSILYVSAITSFSQVKSGLLLGGGTGSLRTQIDYNSPHVRDLLKQIKEYHHTNYRFNASIGYRFRIQTVASSFFYDLDAHVGLKIWESRYGRRYSAIGATVDSWYYYASISGTVNYPVYKRLSAGIGIEPLCYFRTEGESSRISPAIDIPPVVRLSCNLNVLEIGVSYKYGLCNVMKTDYLKSGRINDLVLSLYIPF